MRRRGVLCVCFRLRVESSTSTHTIYECGEGTGSRDRCCTQVDHSSSSNFNNAGGGGVRREIKADGRPKDIIRSDAHLTASPLSYPEEEGVYYRTNSLQEYTREVLHDAGIEPRAERLHANARRAYNSKNRIK